MNSEVHRNILSATLKTDLIKLTGRSSFMQQDNNPKHTTKTAKEKEVEAFWLTTKEECKGLEMSVGRRLDAVIASKGLANKY